MIKIWFFFLEKYLFLKKTKNIIDFLSESPNPEISYTWEIADLRSLFIVSPELPRTTICTHNDLLHETQTYDCFENWIWSA
jgi:hypothetical protein